MRPRHTLPLRDDERRHNGVKEPAIVLVAGRPRRSPARARAGWMTPAHSLIAWEAEAARLTGARECWRKCSVVAVSSRPRGATSTRRRPSSPERSPSTRRSGTCSDALGRYWRSALSGDGVRQRRAAREAIEAALEGFEACGAAGWAEKARAELGTIGGRTRIEGLTPAEGRIAALVAEGRTNREVAAALFLTEHTVATALTRVYRKLGVRSRTELARLAQTQDADLAKT